MINFLAPPDETDRENEYRRNLAVALMKEGMDTSPIRHWTQGAARLSNSLFGGFNLGQLEAEAKKENEEKYSGLAKALSETGSPSIGRTTFGKVSDLAPPSAIASSPDVPKEGRALLDSIAGSESNYPGKDPYKVIYGGREATSFADHPRQYVPIVNGPNKGLKTSAAGRYQYLGRSWDEAKNALGLPDFSPDSQDRAAWWDAQRTYKTNTGRDLQSDLAIAGGDPQKLTSIGRGLSTWWTSLPGGIEPNKATGSFGSRLAKALMRGEQPPDQVAEQTPVPATPIVPSGEPFLDSRNPMVASADPRFVPQMDSSPVPIASRPGSGPALPSGVVPAIPYTGGTMPQPASPGAVAAVQPTGQPTGPQPAQRSPQPVGETEAQALPPAFSQPIRMADNRDAIVRMLQSPDKTTRQMGWALGVQALQRDFADPLETEKRRLEVENMRRGHLLTPAEEQQRIRMERANKNGDTVKVVPGPTETLILRPGTGEIVARYPKDVGGAEAAKQEAKAQSQAKQQFEAQAPSIRDAINQVDDILQHPSLNNAVGPIAGRLPSVTPGSRDFDERVDQLRGQAFLAARQALKGGGQITDFEGARAEAALVRAGQSKSVDDFKKAMGEFKTHLDRGYSLLAKQAGYPVQDGQTRAQDQTAKPQPAIGDVVDGWKYKGGDPGLQQSWEKAK